MKYRFGMFAAFLYAMVIALSARGAQVTIDSPQKLVQGVVTVDGEISLDLNFRGRAVLIDSPLGLTFEDGAYGPLSLLRIETRQINSRWENRFGRSRDVRDRAAEVT
ncbi:MAG: glycoside hydrolase family 97 N-terminal domain-containing protein, partial [Thermoguttaceae bacterium]|nr:glycoside hydrolase family 97 N-terminal domain-containing protein [Thermoguttaceae bacterium]